MCVCVCVFPSLCLPRAFLRPVPCTRTRAAVHRCYINSFRTTTSSMVAIIGVSPEEMYQRYMDGEFSEYTPLVG